MTCFAHPAFASDTSCFTRFIVQGRPETENNLGGLALELQDQTNQTNLGYVYVESMQDFLVSKNINLSSVALLSFPTYHLIMIPVMSIFTTIAALYRQFTNPTGKNFIDLIEPDYQLAILAPAVTLGKNFRLGRGGSMHRTYRQNLNVDAAARDNATGFGTRIAIIDTGLESGQVAMTYTDVTQPGVPPQADNDGHGTAMFEIVGDVAPRAELHVIRVTDSTNVFVWELIKGVKVAVYGWNAHIVSISIGCKDLDLPCGVCGGQQGNRSTICEHFFDLIRQYKAFGHDPIIVAATGNDGNSAAFDWPARYPSVLAVGSLNSHNQPSSFSNMTTVKLQPAYCMCPGGEINASGAITEYVGEGRYANQTTYCLGTSPATAYAAGVLALRRHYNELNYRATDSATLLDEADRRAGKDIPNYNAVDHGMGRLIYQP